MRLEYYLALICISLITDVSEYYFKCFLAIRFAILSIFYILWTFSIDSFLDDVRNFSSFLYTNPQSVLGITNIFSWSVIIQLLLSMVQFTNQTFLILMF